MTTITSKTDTVSISDLSRRQGLSFQPHCTLVNSIPSMTTAGWDLPPPIASPVKGEWKSRPMRWRTPQRIASLNTGETTTCHPILVLERYLVVAGTGFVSLFSLEQVDLDLEVSSSSTLTVSSESKQAYWKYQSPTARLDLDRDATIIQLLDSKSIGDDDEEESGFGILETAVETAVISEGESADKSSRTSSTSHSIFALSEEGDVYHLQIVLPISKSPNSNDNDPSSEADAAATLFCADSWNTGTFGPTCFQTLHWGKEYPENLSMVIGYESGHLEGWRISNSPITVSTPKGSPVRRSSSTSSPSKRVMTTERDMANRTKSKSADGKEEIMGDSTLFFTMQWRGYLHQAPIRSLTALGQQAKVTKESFEADERTDVKTSLVLTMEIPENSPEMQGTASMVDVLEIDFKLLHIKFISNNRRSLRLFPYLEMPTGGMEFVDSSTVGGTTILSGMDISGSGQDGESGTANNAMEYFPKRLSMLPSQGTDSSISLSFGKQCGVSLSDGTVAILSSNTEIGRSTSSWGITKDVHQLLLSYPAIGCGSIHMQHHGGDYVQTEHETSKKEYIACCLRGGTCFLIPIVDEEVQQDIVAIPYLHDIDADWTTVYLQGFTAGDLRVTTNSSDTIRHQSVPIVVYALAGGTLDVYACSLMHRPMPDIEKAAADEEKHECLSSLVQQGDTLSIVSKLLEQMNKDENDPLWEEPLWKETHEAFQSSEILPTAITMDQIQSPIFASFKRLLLSLASS
ncbi:unnamed protein product [Cylindrotheca closterium]|uniref:Uncharacterized protein n=1 Tax=Cylindrotheca closterium TaxID=2856 RepID=A0AAD2FWB2_9STRA|nr:unnamed protein product [Cylindrotheca closterium]